MTPSRGQGRVQTGGGKTAPCLVCYHAPKTFPANSKDPNPSRDQFAQPSLHGWFGASNFVWVLFAGSFFLPRERARLPRERVCQRFQVWFVSNWVLLTVMVLPCGTSGSLMAMHGWFGCLRSPMETFMAAQQIPETQQQVAEWLHGTFFNPQSNSCLHIRRFGVKILQENSECLSVSDWANLRPVANEAPQKLLF